MAKKNKKSKISISGGFRNKERTIEKKPKHHDPLSKKELHKSKISLDKDERKIAKKTLGSMPKIPKDLAEIRSKCNHQCGALTPQEYAERGLNQFMVPLLPQFEEVFGKSVRICEVCGDVYVDGSAITPDQLTTAAMMFYGALNVYLASCDGDVKKKDISELNKLKSMVLKDILTFVGEYRENYSTIISNDNSADTNTNRPNGNTYTV